MSDSPGLFLAFWAGVVSFVSPCVLPLVPGYLAAVSGGRGHAAVGGRIDARMMARSLLFVATFSAIFILLGLGATAIGGFLRDHRTTLNKVAGVTIVVLGLLFIAAVFVVRLNRDWRPAGLMERAGRGGPVVAGAAFAVAWTPCVGPTLAAIFSLATTSSGTGRGALLLAFYSAGLGLPFLFCAVAFSSAQRAFGWIKRHYTAIQVTAGVVLVVMGVLVYTGEFFRLNIEAQNVLRDLGINFFNDV
ncbi:MAG: cytochrome c biogenesis CcdA family protein [Actinomycetota bacterium]|nr:cytochrome c biogenesis CcdA family protein [Actinomycetota bacterium]